MLGGALAEEQRGARARSAAAQHSTAPKHATHLPAAAVEAAAVITAQADMNTRGGSVWARLGGSRNLLIFSKRHPENSPEKSQFLYLYGNHWQGPRMH